MKINKICQKTIVTMSLHSHNDDNEVGDTAEDQCPICLITPSDIALECGHKFCFACLDEWYRRQKESVTLCCPYCKQHVEQSSDTSCFHCLLRVARHLLVLVAIFTCIVQMIVDEWPIDWLRVALWFGIYIDWASGGCSIMMTMPFVSIFVLLFLTGRDDGVVTLLWEHYESGCSIWSNQCLFPIGGNGHHELFLTKFFTIMTENVVCFVASVAYCLLDRVNIKKSFLYRKLKLKMD